MYVANFLLYRWSRSIAVTQVNFLYLISRLRRRENLRHGTALLGDMGENRLSQRHQMRNDQAVEHIRLAALFLRGVDMGEVRHDLRGDGGELAVHLLPVPSVPFFALPLKVEQLHDVVATRRLLTE